MHIIMPHQLHPLRSQCAQCTVLRRPVHQSGFSIWRGRWIGIVRVLDLGACQSGSSAAFRNLWIVPALVDLSSILTVRVFLLVIRTTGSRLLLVMS